MEKRVSLTQYLVEQQREHGHIPAELRLLIEVVARACKHIAIAVTKGELGEASMVADVHRVLTRGGVFLYPWDKREPDKPGKLRLLYEASPMGFLVEQAGGLASNGHQRILDIVPGTLHERVSVVLGSKHEVERVADYHLPAGD